MDYIREALDKANVSLDKSRAVPPPLRTVANLATATRPTPLSGWTARQVNLDPKHLERHRVVSFSMSDPGHVPFNLLRTRLRALMSQKGWKTIGITSPSPACGKTMVSTNLALSLARGADVRTVLLDFDLRRPGVAQTLGIAADATISAFLRGEAEAGDCFVQAAPGLTIGLGGGHARDSSELIQGARTKQLFDFVDANLAPDVILCDLPPMGVADDVLAFLPHVDATILVAAAGQTSIAQIDSCEQQISQHGNFVGVVLNKAEGNVKEYYY